MYSNKTPKGDAECSNCEQLRVAYERSDTQNDEMREAVRKFLGAQGHELCHENRRELAKAFNLVGHAISTEGVSCEEFCNGCANYQRKLYGRAERDRPPFGCGIALAVAVVGGGAFWGFWTFVVWFIFWR